MATATATATEPFCVALHRRVVCLFKRGRGLSSIRHRTSTGRYFFASVDSEIVVLFLLTHVPSPLRIHAQRTSLPMRNYNSTFSFFFTSFVKLEGDDYLSPNIMSETRSEKLATSLLC